LARRIAVFPQKSGPLAVGPFHLDETLTTASGGRREVRLDTPPLTIAVAPAPKDFAGWWLPVKSLSVKDEWDPDPQDIPVDGLAHRTVTLEALGALGDQLPPVPILRSPPIVTFARQESRDTVLTSQGPVGRVVYRWDVRAAHEEPSLLQGVGIPWFDTTARSMAEARIPERRVAERLLLVKEEPDAASLLLQWLDWRAIAAGAALGLALLIGRIFLTLRPRRSLTVAAIRRAAARGDAAGMRLAIARLTCDAPFPAGGEAAKLLALLDAHLYAPAAAPSPDLRRLAACIAREHARSSRWNAPQKRSALLPLDSDGTALPNAS
jgi:hypothetical protein